MAFAKVASGELLLDAGSVVAHGVARGRLGNPQALPTRDLLRRVLRPI
jgi:hypothetical protein